MSTVVYNVKIKGDPEELLKKVHQWIDNDLMKGRVSGNFFTIREIDKNLVKEANESFDGLLTSTIEGVVENNRLMLSAEVTIVNSVHANMGRILALVMAIALAAASQSLLFGVLIMIGAILVISFGNHSMRRRIENDLDVFVWIVNTRSKVQLIRQER